MSQSKYGHENGKELDSRLLIGRKLSQFTITAKLGEGGMGAVYRATDTKLGREVAIKVLPEAFTQDAERLARFEREAKVLASLNHSNIAAIYEVGEALPSRDPSTSVAEAPSAEDDTALPCHFIAMELAEGEDLSERLGHGPIPIDEALAIARQIAEALEAAHEHGIVHRDLKPANVKLGPDGHVKVLDFGLAKARGGGKGTADISHSPTLTAQMTQAGALLGTAAYMSPEQARGQEADRRSDVWAFGLLLAEMLSGRKTFHEDTVSDTLAAILKSEPDFSDLPTGLPRALRRLIDRCLRKDPRERLRDMGDIGLELREIATRLKEPSAAAETSTLAETGHPTPSWRMPLLGLLLGAVAALGTWALLPSGPRSPSSLRPLVRFGITTPPATTFVRGLAVSPDGSTVAMTVRNEDGLTEIWLRSLDSLEARLLPGTERARFPFWSPDGRYLAFSADYELKVVDRIGTPPRTLARLPVQASDARGGTWGTDGTIVYAPNFSGGFRRIANGGGEPEIATVLDPEGNNGTHRFPWFLPDGRHFVFYAATGTGTEPGEIRMGQLGSTTTRFLTQASSLPVFAPPNRLIFTRGDVLVTQRFDLDRFETVGEAEPLGIRLPGGLAISGLRSLSVSAQGTLVYLVEDYSWTKLEFVNRDGVLLGSLGDDQTWHYVPRVSPDGRSVAVTRYAADTENGDIWLFERERSLGTPLVTGPNDQDTAAWSPDGRRLAYMHLGPEGTSLRTVDRDGAQEVILQQVDDFWVNSWLPDGKELLLDHLTETGYEISLLSLDGSSEPRSLVSSGGSEWNAEPSPDGRWMAYSSDVTGRREVYVRPFDGSQPPWRVSTEGGLMACWSPDGTEIFFVSLDDWMMAAAVTDTDRFATAPPVQLFKALIDTEQFDRQFDIAPDGSFLINRRGSDATEPITVVLGLDRLLEP